MNRGEGPWKGISKVVVAVYEGLNRGRKKPVSACTVGWVEREKGFEPSTACLEGRNSSAELLPLEAPKDGHPILAAPPG